MAFSPAAKAALRTIGGRSHHYNPDEPRLPRGVHGGGQWTDDGVADDSVAEEAKIQELIARAKADPRVIEAERVGAEAGDARDLPGVRNPDGTYTESAKAENNRIADSFLNDEAKPKFGRRPVATLVIGKPGAGKSTMLALPEVAKNIPKSVMINPDLIKERIPGFTNALGSSFHERSSDITGGVLIPKTIAGRYNLILDASGKNHKKMEDIVRSLKTMGYEVNVLWADTSNLTAAERVHQRFIKGGRYMPVEVAARDYRSGPHASFEIMKHTGLADRWSKYDTTNRQLKLLESSPTHSRRRR